MSVTYFRNTYGNILASTNAAVSASDFTQYCVTVPTDSRLPTSGSQICGLYDVAPAKFGQVRTEIKRASDLGVGDISRVYNSVDITVQGRFARGLQLSGGTNIGRTTFDDCALNSLPQAFATGSGWVNNGQDSTTGGVPHPKTDAFCTVQAPLMKIAQFKLNGVLPLPYGFQVAGVFQSLPGASIQIARRQPTCFDSVCMTFTNAQIAPSLGRNLSAGANGTVLIPITVPQTLFEKRLNQLDFRVTRVFKLQQVTLKANMDLYNTFNANYVTGVSGTYNPANPNAFLTPTTVMGARFIRFTGQINF